MFDSIRNVGDFLSPHWLSEAFPARLKDLTRQWRDNAEHGKHSPLRGLGQAAGPYLAARTELPPAGDAGFPAAVTELHRLLADAVGIPLRPRDEGLLELETEQSETPVTVPLLARCQGRSGEALHVLQAEPVSDVEDLFSDQARLLNPVRLQTGTETVTQLADPQRAVQQLFLTADAPRFVLLMAGGWVVLSDVQRWAEGRYLAFDVHTAMLRRDDKATGELAWHAGLWAGDVLLPAEDGSSRLDEFSQDSIKHAVGVSEDLREGLRISVELIANEVLRRRREQGLACEGDTELPAELTRQSLRFLYRILFLLYAEARPELAVLPVGAPEYDAGYGLDRLRQLIQVPLTGASRDGHHLHDSLRLLFRLVNDGHGHAGTGSEGLVFEPLRADLFETPHAKLVDEMQLSNVVLQRVLELLLLSKPGRASGGRRGFISYAQLGINQLGAVYEGLMAYSGFIAERDLAELAKNGDPSDGCWLVPAEQLGSYDQQHMVRREDPQTGALEYVVHKQGSFVYRLSGRDRQRSASYYTPEVLTQCVVRHSLAELLDEQTPAEQILQLRVCEPAMGSGAFLNEALNQLAGEYLRRRQSELGQTISPEDYRGELQKVKAYLALHRCYGVDLNDTARELAEVSLWLNVMHPGLQAPWFGLHLKRGNSLVGARRASYDFTSLGRSKRSWLSTPPTERPLHQEAVPVGEIHHFLLPAHGWGAVADSRIARDRRPQQVRQLKDWRKRIRTKPDAKELARLKGLAIRAERLWELTRRRLEISEREVSREVAIWGRETAETTAAAEAAGGSAGAVSREQVEEALIDPEGPYQRLRLVMDAWCALFYWPPHGEVDPPEREEWLATLEGLLGVQGKNLDSDNAEFIETTSGFHQLAQIDQLEASYYGLQRVADLLMQRPWLGEVRRIAQQEGFFHWELDFAQVFSRGGFDLQLGNPPWVRPTWNDDVTLAEFEPFFMLTDRIPTSTFRNRREQVLDSAENEGEYLAELSAWAGLNEQLGSAVEHPVLHGVQTNLYLNFMERTWRCMHPRGVVGMLHPEGHFTDPKAGQLRAATYRRLRRHWQFINEAQLFADVHNQTIYGVQIYAASGEIDFRQASHLLLPETLDASLAHDGAGEVPGLQYPSGGWDHRPHASRIVRVTADVLASWARLFDETGTPAERARLLRPVTHEQLEALEAMSAQPARMADLRYWWTSGWHESSARADGYTVWRTEYPPSWDEAILQGPHFSVATPFAKEPNENCSSNRDYSDWDLEELPERVVPRTNYQRACDPEAYDAGLQHWNGHPNTTYWRLAWRNMTQSGSERSLISALVPPGPTHVHTVHTLAAGTPRQTALLSGLWSAVPLDYLVKVSGASKVNKELADHFPAPLDHPAAPLLLLRTLRLNCLTRDYAPLWEELYEPGFANDSWTSPFADWPKLAVPCGEWSRETPLRSEFERRAALVELDALAAIMLGLTADQLCLMYRGQFAVLRKYEYNMHFDNLGQKIAKAHHAHGVKQEPDDFKLLQAHLNEEDSGDLLDRYEPPITPVDREAEMRAAYQDFQSRLR